VSVHNLLLLRNVLEALIIVGLHFVRIYYRHMTNRRSVCAKMFCSLQNLRPEHILLLLSDRRAKYIGFVVKYLEFLPDFSRLLTAGLYHTDAGVSFILYHVVQLSKLAQPTSVKTESEHVCNDSQTHSNPTHTQIIAVCIKVPVPVSVERPIVHTPVKPLVFLTRVLWKPP